MRTQWGVFRGRQPWVAQSFRKRKLDTESQLIGNGNIWRHSEWQKVETEHSNNSKLDQPHQIRGSQVTWLTSIVDCGSCSILIPKHVFLLLCYMYFFGSGNHTSLFLNWSNWIRFWGSRLTCLVSPGPLHLDIAPPALQLTIFNRIPLFLPELKKGSSCCGLPGSDNVCSRSLVSKVNHPRLNYWHPSTAGGLNYDALNQTGVPCNYIHFTQLDSQLQPRCAKYQFLKPVRKPT